LLDPLVSIVVFTADVHAESFNDNISDSNQHETDGVATWLAIVLLRDGSTSTRPTASSRFCSD
jgi:hypothetical protein